MSLLRNTVRIEEYRDAKGNRRGGRGKNERTNGPSVGKPDVAGNNLLHPTTCCTPLKILHASPSNFTVNCLFGKKSLVVYLIGARPGPDLEQELVAGRALLVELRPGRTKKKADRRTPRQQIERFYYDVGSTSRVVPRATLSPLWMSLTF